MKTIIRTLLAIIYVSMGCVWWHLLLPEHLTWLENWQMGGLIMLSALSSGLIGILKLSPWNDDL
jgi:hypothetical protein